MKKNVNLSTKKETKVRVEINETETKKQRKRLMNLRAYSNKTGKPLARFTKRKENIKIHKIRNEGDITVYPLIYKIIKLSYETVMHTYMPTNCTTYKKWTNS